MKHYDGPAFFKQPMTKQTSTSIKHESRSQVSETLEPQPKLEDEEEEIQLTKNAHAFLGLKLTPRDDLIITLTKSPDQYYRFITPEELDDDQNLDDDQSLNYRFGNDETDDLDDLDEIKILSSDENNQAESTVEETLPDESTIETHKTQNIIDSLESGEIDAQIDETIADDQTIIEAEKPVDESTSITNTENPLLTEVAELSELVKNPPIQPSRPSEPVNLNPIEIHQIYNRFKTESVGKTTPTTKQKDFPKDKGTGREIPEQANQVIERPDTTSANENQHSVVDKGVESESVKDYVKPDLAFLAQPIKEDASEMVEWAKKQAAILDQTFADFNIDAKVTHWTIGPSVTQLEVSLASGIRINRITNLNDDLKMALAAKDIRIEAPIPGKNTIGIEIPNLKSRMVTLSEVIDTDEFRTSKSPLTIALGVNLFGKPILTRIDKMPHGLIAGATGSGKSVFISSMLLSLLYHSTPDEVKLMLIDPKAVELSAYNGLPQLVSPVITDPKEASAALKWAVSEMEERYQKLSAAHAHNIEQFNQKATESGQVSQKMPYIVIVIDELADLMMVASSDVQESIARITQKARAAGIHLIVATQRPSVDVITGTIKNNIPTRIAFMVSSQTDSRTVIDVGGAERLLGNGDMLFLEQGHSQPTRIQGTYVGQEIETVTGFIRDHARANYWFEPNALMTNKQSSAKHDDLFPDVLEYLANEKTISTSKLQRVFSIGYNRAANLIDDLELKNFVSPAQGSKPREVYLTPDQFYALQEDPDF